MHEQDECAAIVRRIRLIRFLAVINDECPSRLVRSASELGNAILLSIM